MVKPIYTLNSLEISKLELISKSKNGPGKPLYREDLPSILFNRAPRVLLGDKWFSEYTNKTNQATSCQTCGNRLNLERHELYSLYKYNNTYLIKLEGILILCSKCHKIIHGGFSTNLGMHRGYLPEVFPKSTALSPFLYPWNKAKYLLIENNLYNFN